MTKVLVVDDAKFMRMTLKNVLENSAFEVVGEAENGEEAVEKYKSLNPDLVTMDITMPVLDGISAAKKILKEDPRATIIMCSAMGQQKMVIEAIEAGAKDFIVKPFDSNRVVESLSRVINK
ncbi:response regulator [Jeotgalibacillus terrae]|uniref:Response regulator n=1 Tax=Jeotgalibacillus terrae TaxID=587735 RepID=A0ABW5ZPS9_9BACL|nr:response regulator [Jeotgalibacillus terrae]MBM7580263.1 two-component system chemotaxis response regulator CheY [Jeotgalibacillus terrae]